MIYLDNAATTPVYPEAAEAMGRVLREDFFNPSSTYPGGMRAQNLIREARSSVAEALGCTANELYFTSCATEADNWAITSGFKNKHGNIVVSAGEHACVYECAMHLKSAGLDVRFAALDRSGRVDPGDLMRKVNENTCLVSVIHASNETGAINDIASLAAAVKSKSRRALFHSDGVQAFLKTDFDLRSSGVDLYAVSGHKVGAPKGVGALFVSSKVHIAPFIYGGGQESGMRSGTENVAGIVAFGAAVRAYKSRFDPARARALYERLVSGLYEKCGAAVIAGGGNGTYMIAAVTIEGVKAEILQSVCADEGVIIGRGSACASRHSGNRVLEAMGLTKKEVDGAIRISLSPETTEEEIDVATDVISRAAEKVRGRRIG